LEEGLSYEYRLTAVNRWVGAFTEPVRVDLRPAVDVAGATATWTGEGVFVGWADASAHELGYRVERSVDGVNFETLVELLQRDEDGGYFDATAAERTSYTYRVVAVGEFAESAPATVSEETGSQT
jgi:hypothetical protein